MSSPNLNPVNATDPKVSQVRVIVKDIGTDGLAVITISIVTDILPGVTPPPDYYSMNIFLKPPNQSWIALPWKQLANEPCGPDYSHANTQDPACKITELMTKTYSYPCAAIPLIPHVFNQDITELKIRINDEDPYFIGGFTPNKDSNNREIGFLATVTM